ncbi:MAG: ferritin-like domain-containing protein, partial [Azospirillaceae bacterium]
RLAPLGRADPPTRPARPERPELRPPSAMPKRRKARSAAGRVALLHALAHIELNAVDLACDMIARFADPERAGEVLPDAFFDDWCAVADDEGRHFLMLADRLAAFGAAYGDLPAHDGLWQAAEATAGDLLARLAVVPMVLEARGLDVTPGMIANLDAAGDADSAAILRIIHDEEIGHVAAGVRWFRHVAASRGMEAEPQWRALVRQYYRGPLKPPFNAESRARAGMEPALYEPLAG